MRRALHSRLDSELGHDRLRFEGHSLGTTIDQSNAVAAAGISGLLGGVFGFLLGGAAATGLWLWYYEGGKK